MAFTLTSPAFKEGEPVPKRFTCDGEDLSPPLAWSGAPMGTVAYGLIMSDPDAPRGTWTHWTWWDLPASMTSLAEGADVAKLGAIEGATSALTVGYHGPCPPAGMHRYVITLHALMAPLALPEGASIMDTVRTMTDRSLESCRLVGVYQRS